ncbi:MAG: zinc/iron-chelating domain-containing protein [Geothermobacteraceae bacterium]
MPDQSVMSAWQHLADAIEMSRTQLQKAGGTIHCRAGCGNCCRLAVMTTAAEARGLARKITEPTRERLEHYIDRLRTLLPAIADRTDLVRLHPHQLGPCPFLGPDEHCDVHAHRPLACRALLATRPADWCGLNLSTLPDIERRLFLDSLDANLVALPTHYLQAPLEKARQLEQELLARPNLNLYGHLPTLVWLEITVGLEQVAERDSAGFSDQTDTSDLIHPALVEVTG